MACACICAGGALRVLSAGLLIAGMGTGRAIAMSPFSKTARGDRRNPHPRLADRTGGAVRGAM
jgi:hypothetical protein